MEELFAAFKKVASEATVKLLGLILVVGFVGGALMGTWNAFVVPVFGARTVEFGGGLALELVLFIIGGFVYLFKEDR